MADGLKRFENNIELMLELSIGGIFDNIEKPKQSTGESVETHDGPRDLDVSVEPIVQSKRHIDQATWRRELRRKREEMLKKSEDFGSCDSVSGPFEENKEWLEKQFTKQNDDVLEIHEPARKKERVGSLQGNICLNTTGRVMDEYVNHGVIPESGDARFVAQNEEEANKKSCGFGPKTVCRSFRPCDMNLKADVDGGGRRICKLNSNGSGGFASSLYSDGQCSSHQDDSKSNSSNSQLEQQLASTSAESANPSDPRSGSPKQTVLITKLTNSAVSKPSQAKPHESSVSNPSCKLDQTRIQHQQASVLARMPCVSTTGNGPNGKTISGFLYRYTKNDVSIMCVCHGQSFNPAGFVEHAGGVDIPHPLKHITIFPTAFAS